MSRSDEPRGEPSLLELSRGEDASRREPRSEWHKKNFAPQPRFLSLDCGAKLYKKNEVTMDFPSYFRPISVLFIRV